MNKTNENKNTVVFTVYCQLCAKEKLIRVNPIEVAEHEIKWMRKNDCCLDCAVRMNAFAKTYPQSKSDF